MMQVIAWAYEADYHCPDCAWERFGWALEDPDTVDDEGNPLHPVFSWDEAPVNGIVCGDCGGVIVPPVSAQCPRTSMLVQETYVNATRGYQYGETDWYEPYTENIGRLFLHFQREHGRCISKVYIDTEKGTLQVGWVFQKRVRYEDARPDWTGKYREDDYYIREVWVSFANDDRTPMDISRKARRKLST